MNLLRTKLLFLTFILLLGCGVLWAAYQELSPAAPVLAAWAPKGAVLAIEAKDFSALLKDWSSSEQQRAWLASDNYADFSRSRLFSRLGEAQQQFAVSAGLPADMNFLTQVAGKESLFAWYDIGNLEFLYITHMPASASVQTQLLQQRSKFEARKAGEETFYVRSQGDPKRSVAFAVHGDYLLLATREDLLANALLLMQAPGKNKDGLGLRDEHWYASAAEATHAAPGDLRMTLNLSTIVPSPYFRSYWIQQNISEMKQYAAATIDLYRTPENFREQRVLLPKSPDSVFPAVDMAPLFDYLPASTGVYRAKANPDADQVIAVLKKKLLLRDIAEFQDNNVAPVADVSEQTVGGASDLETQIDEPPVPQQPLTLALAPLRSLLDAAHVGAMLTTSSTGDVPDHLFLPIHSSVVLSASVPWKAEALEAALSEALRARLTAGDNGLRWETRQQGNLAWFELEGLQPLAFSLQGNICVLATNSDALLQTLHATHSAAPHPQVASVAAGFNHTAERPQFAELTRLLDQSAKSAAQNSHDDPKDERVQPGFFSGNIRSLSDTFQALDAETFVEMPEPDTHLVRQTVVYQWKH